MKIEDQVCTIEQAKRLSELGLKQQSNFKYNQNLYETEKAGDINEGIYTIWYNHFPCCNNQYSAFTVAELGMMLPEWIYDENKLEYRLKRWKACADNKNQNNNWGIRYDSSHGIKSIPKTDSQIVSGLRAKTEAQALAAMLIYLLEKNLIAADEANKNI